MDYLSPHSYSIHNQIFKREINEHFGQHRVISNLKSSQDYLERMSLWKTLKGHRGCVNSVLFSETGEYIFTGSDDTRVNLYQSNSGSLIESFRTLHTQNVFYAKDLPCQSTMDYIVTCAADGKVSLMNIHTKNSRMLYRHTGRAHRIALIPNEPMQFYSCGEDGVCCFYDLREKVFDLMPKGTFENEELIQTISRGNLPAFKINHKNPKSPRNVSIYSIGVNPSNNFEIAIAGMTPRISLFDIRVPTNPFSFLCPTHLLPGDSNRQSQSHVTGIKYNYNGSLLLASYNDEQIYTFQVPNNLRFIESTSSEDSAFPLSRMNAEQPTTNFPQNDETANEEENEAETKQTKFPDNDNNESIENQDFGYYRRYSGHKNSDTVKQVSFYGPKSEFVVSGSDCGHLFFWGTESTNVLKVFKADSQGAINCLASHPITPLFASSGLEKSAKLWLPFGERTPLIEGTEEFEKVEKIISNNLEDRPTLTSRRLSSRALRSILRMMLNSVDEVDLDEEEEEEGEVGIEDLQAGVRRRELGGEGEEDTRSRPRRRYINIREMAFLLPFLEANLTDEIDEDNEEEDLGDDTMDEVGGENDDRDEEDSEEEEDVEEEDDDYDDDNESEDEESENSESDESSDGDEIEDYLDSNIEFIDDDSSDFDSDEDDEESEEEEYSEHEIDMEDEVYDDDDNNNDEEYGDENIGIFEIDHDEESSSESIIEHDDEMKAIIKEMEEVD